MSAAVQICVQMPDGAFVKTALTTVSGNSRFEKLNAKTKSILQLHNAKEYFTQAYLSFSAIASKARFGLCYCMACIIRAFWG